MNGKHIIWRYLIPVLAAILLSGCDKSENLASSQEDIYVEMAFSRDSNGTKAEIGDDGSGAFSEGDKVGLYIHGEQTRHIILTLEDGQWAPKLRKSELGSGTVRLSAYYPAREDVSPETGRHTHRVSEDQTGDGYAESDLLWSHLELKQENLTGSRIVMPFVHGMHRLTINISSDGGSLPEDLSVTVRNIAEGSFNLSTGKPEIPSGTTGSIRPRELSQPEGKFSAILFPGKLETYADEWVLVSTGGKTSVFKAPATIGGSGLMESGKETVLNLKLKSDGGIGTDPVPDMDYGGKTCWIYGVKTDDLPDYPRDNEESVPECSFLVPENFPDGAWFNVSGTICLNWQEGYLWTDCDKDNPDGSGKHPGFNDSDMCWAAAASNLLHWWTRLNEPYIKAYDKKYNPDPWPKYPRPSFVFSDKGSSGIFDVMREMSMNRGGADAVGVNWFICGTPGIPPANSGVYNNFGGYFTEIFDNIDIAVPYEGGMNKEDFNRVVKDALENRQALGFIQSNLKNPSTHVMTIWGVEFDDEGYASALYYVDNNDHYRFETTGGSNDFQHHRLIRQTISYQEGLWKIMMGTSGSYAIAGITVVDLKRDIWAKEFPEVEISEDFIN